jgi:hypothetical protein
MPGHRRFGHGAVHAPAAGRGIAELVLGGRHGSLGLTPFDVRRIAAGDPLDDVQASEHRRCCAGG